MMVKNGILNKLRNGPLKTGGLLSNEVRDDLDGFLAWFKSAWQHVAAESHGMVDGIAVSEIARIPVADIAALGAQDDCLGLRRVRKNCGLSQSL